MKPNFPGMNPYLEDPEIWVELHSWLIVQLARSLNPQLTPKYRAAVEKRVYTDTILVGIPDVSVFSKSKTRADLATAILTAPPETLCDREPLINLKTLLDQIYEEAALDLVIDYAAPPKVKLQDEDWEWVRSIAIT
jgi:Protein of unknown function (DUF4058)